jgi:hypothetical protein
MTERRPCRRYDPPRSSLLPAALVCVAAAILILILGQFICLHLMGVFH